jgi:hypothetical protein
MKRVPDAALLLGRAWRYVLQQWRESPDALRSQGLWCALAILEHAECDVRRDE